MHPSLRCVFEKTAELIGSDPRVLACWLSGSAGDQTAEDEFSDVDPVFVIRDEDFDSVDLGLRSIFDSICPDIVLWWPESCNCEWLRNYAILMKTPELIQYDVNILKASKLSPGWLVGCRAEQVVFDKTGILTSALSEARPQRYSAEKLVWHIERWWLYVYINAKYLRRDDTFKLLFVQQTLFEDHLEILRALHPEVHWQWWPISVKRHLSRERQAELKHYFPSADKTSIVAALRQETEVFSRDARSACEKHGLRYPDELEASIRAYLAEKGVLGE